jgi:SAM-dependent methyltransferase
MKLTATLARVLKGPATLAPAISARPQENASEVDVEAIMRRLASELSSASSDGSGDRKARATSRGKTDVFPIRGVTLPRMPEDAARIERKSAYRLADFLQFGDESFIHNAYRGILRREADDEGFAAYTAELRAGRLSKTEIVGRLRYSKEGRAAGVRVRGLLPPFLLHTARRVPIAGRLLGIVQYAVLLPDMARNQRRLEALFVQQQSQSNRQVNATVALIEAELSRMQQSFRDALDLKANTERLTLLSNGLVERVARKVDRSEFAATLSKTSEQLDDLRSALRTVESAAEANVTQAKHTMAALARLESGRVDLDRQVHRLGGVMHDLELAFARRPRASAEQAPQSLAATTTPASDSGNVHSMDLFYASFEDQFRGPTHEIRSRAEIYLPRVREAGAGVTESPIVDLGCGRGEWLALLRENGLVARGLDLNRVMVSRCEELGLEVIEADALSHLGGIADGALGAITAMHVIEHMPFESLVRLLDEAWRTLRSGGIAIFETPNPENLTVGACTFYADPTHLRPLPPDMMRFVAEARGFAPVEVLRLHPYPPEHQISDGHPTLARWINDKFYGPRDYALVMRKSS